MVDVRSFYSGAKAMDVWRYKDKFNPQKSEETITLELYRLYPDPAGGSPVDEYRGDVTSLDEANAFLDSGDGMVQYQGEIVGYNWGEKEYVRLRNGVPVRVM